METAERTRNLTEIRDAYKEGHRRHQAAADGLRTRGRRIENLRGLSFAVAAVSLGFYLAKGNPAWAASAVASALAFFWLVQHHGRVIEREEHQRRFALVSEHGLKRATGDFHDLPRAGSAFAPADHPSAADLDLFGVASLYQRISVAHTRFGQTTLAHWIAEPASIEEIHARKQAVLELYPAEKFRHALQAEGMALVEKRTGEITQLSDGPNPARLLSWVRRPTALANRPLLRALAILLPIATLGGIAGAWWGLLAPIFWAAPVLASLIFIRFTSGPTTTAFSAVSTTEGAFLRYGALLELLEKESFQCPWLKHRQADLKSSQGAQPSAVMRKFRAIVSWYDLRHNGMVHPFVNTLLLWDFHCTVQLEKWSAQTGASLTRWFEVIGEFEAMSSLAGFYADDPDSNLPVVCRADDADASLCARGLTHPLLPPGARVKNDVEAFGPGQALLVTGSNMSGKSTFLRSLGVNAVLAFMGGPVIAREFRIPHCQLGTSIRVSDSLKTGVSHFYAEVQKLATVVSAAQEKKMPVLFLLDEVLHGTNSRERQVGARWVLSELLRCRAFGVVTTHDMELCRLPEELMSKVRQHHFVENEREGEMLFDYALRPGPVTSGNALRLMRRVGLQVPEN